MLFDVTIQRRFNKNMIRREVKAFNLQKMIRFDFHYPHPQTPNL